MVPPGPCNGRVNEKATPRTVENSKTPSSQNYDNPIVVVPSGSCDGRVQQITNNADRWYNCQLCKYSFISVEAFLLQD